MYIPLSQLLNALVTLNKRFGNLFEIISCARTVALYYLVQLLLFTVHILDLIVQFQYSDHLLLQLSELQVHVPYVYFVLTDVDIFLMQLVQQRLNSLGNQLTDLIHLNELMLLEVHLLHQRILVQQQILIRAAQHYLRLEVIVPLVLNLRVLLLSLYFLAFRNNNFFIHLQLRLDVTHYQFKFIILN